MRSQAGFVEYILLILLSISVFVYSYIWFNANKEYFVDIYGLEKIKKEIEEFYKTLELLKNFDEAVEEFVINADCRCIGNILLIQTKYNCIPYTLNQTFSGYLITVNNTVYAYSNLTGVYYEILKLNGYYYGCYEGSVSYLFEGYNCSAFGKYVCKLKVIINGSRVIFK